MMGDISAIEGMLRELIEQNSQLAPFAAKLSKLTANFQTGKIRKLLKSFVTTELPSMIVVPISKPIQNSELELQNLTFQVLYSNSEFLNSNFQYLKQNCRWIFCTIDAYGCTFPDLQMKIALSSIFSFYF